jgi:hypothetical protein
MGLLAGPVAQRLYQRIVIGFGRWAARLAHDGAPQWRFQPLGG